jgi:hypothetical protein
MAAAAFEAQYSMRFTLASSAFTEEMKTSARLPRPGAPSASMRRSAAWLTKKGARLLTARTLFQESGVTSSGSPRTKDMMPALLTTTSMPPPSFQAQSTIGPISPTSERSHWRMAKRPPSSPTRRAVSSAPSALWSAQRMS